MPGEKCFFMWRYYGKWQLDMSGLSKNNALLGFTKELISSYFNRHQVQAIKKLKLVIILSISFYQAAYRNYLKTINPLFILELAWIPVQSQKMSALFFLYLIL